MFFAGSRSYFNVGPRHFSTGTKTLLFGAKMAMKSRKRCAGAHSIFDLTTTTTARIRFTCDNRFVWIGIYRVGLGTTLDGCERTEVIRRVAIVPGVFGANTSLVARATDTSGTSSGCP